MVERKKKLDLRIVVSLRDLTSKVAIALARNLTVAIMLIVVMIVAAIAARSWAGQADATQNWSVTLSDTCAINNSPSVSTDFDGRTDATGSYAVNILCSNNMAWTLTAGAGNNASGELRRANNASSYIKYRLYKDAARTLELQVTINNTITGTGNGGEQATSVYYAVKQADFAGATNTNHTDTVRMTLSW